MSAGSIIAPACHIFVLEDMATTRAVITHLLTHNLQCRVSAFATPDELWAACADQQPDLFLLDIILEGSVTGIDVCNRLRGNEATRHIPIIFLSVHNQPQTRTEALRSGGVDYVDKPFYPEEFIQRVKGCIERYQHERKLAAQTQEQAALLRVLCHDLRNSVGASMSMLEQVRETMDPLQREEYLDICVRATRSALDLIAHVGEYRSLLDGARPLKMELVDVADACDEALNVIRPMAEAKNITPLLRVEPGLVLRTNRVVLVNSIVVNLLTNALKFSDPGSDIWLEARAEPATPTTPRVCIITLRDEGIGIPDQILQTLLKRQLVVSRPGTSREEGSGIGISLVQLYTERCGGSISLVSQTADPARPDIKSGTTVILRFPQPAPV